MIIWRTRDVGNCPIHAKDGAMAKKPGAIDLARFERALLDLRCPRCANQHYRCLADMTLKTGRACAFEFHPSVRLLDLAGGTAHATAALAAEEEAPAIQQGEEAIVFWRNDGQSFYRLLAEDERLAVMEAQRGRTFGDICALLAFQRNDAGVTRRAAGFLSQWFAGGLVTRLAISD